MITGVGSLSSVGIGSDSHYRALLDGTNGIETLPEWAEEYPCKVTSSFDRPVSFPGRSALTVSVEG